MGLYIGDGKKTKRTKIKLVLKPFKNDRAHFARCSTNVDFRLNAHEIRANTSGLLDVGGNSNDGPKIAFEDSCFEMLRGQLKPFRNMASRHELRRATILLEFHSVDDARPKVVLAFNLFEKSFHCFNGVQQHRKSISSRIIVPCSKHQKTKK